MFSTKGSISRFGWRTALCWRAAWRFLWQKMHAGVEPFVAELKRRGSALFHLDIWQKLDAGYPESPRQWYFDLLISQSMGTFYTGQLLQQNIFTPGTLDNFYTRHLWHQTTFTTNNFYTRHPFTPDIFYTRRLLHQTPLTPGTFYNRQFLQQRAQKHKHSHTRQLLQQNTFTPGTLDNFHTRYLWHQTACTTNNFYTRHPFTQDTF